MFGCIISALIVLLFILSTELYSYTEEPEFALNRDYFEEDFRSNGTVCVCLCLCDCGKESEIISQVC